MPPKAEHSIKFQTAIKALITMLAGMLIGGALAVHLKGQSHSGGYPTSAEGEMIALTTRVSIMDGTLGELVKKVDHLQSEADTTEAMGAGIGFTITGLQLLGFFARGRRGDGG